MSDLVCSTCGGIQSQDPGDVMNLEYGLDAVCVCVAADLDDRILREQEDL